MYEITARGMMIPHDFPSSVSRKTELYKKISTLTVKRFHHHSVLLSFLYPVTQMAYTTKTMNKVWQLRGRSKYTRNLSLPLCILTAVAGVAIS